MQITLNGKPRDLGAEQSLAALVAELDLAGKRFAIEINAEVVPRSTFDEVHLREGDRVEIVHAIGGG